MLVWLALVAVAACGGPPACPVPPRPTAPTPPFLWRVERPGGAVVWLFGTIHNAGEAEVPAAAWRALAASPRFVSELGDTEPDPEQTVALVRLPRGKGLDALLPADDWYELRDALRGVVKEDDLKRARPWYAMSRLTATVAPPPDPTMDFALARRARARGLPVEALESWSVQLAALADAVTLADLQQAIHARKTMRCELADLEAVYLSGDLDAIARRLVIPATATLVVARSRAWLPRIERLFETGGGFVAVGLGHLAGDDGLPAMLARAGYRVERVAP